MKKVLVLEYIDLRFGKANGIHSMIQSMMTDRNTVWAIAGVFSDSNTVDRRAVTHFADNIYEFTVGRLSRNSMDIRLIPNSLKYCFFLLLNRSKLAGDIVHAHRIEIGLASLLLLRKTPLVQFVHNSRYDLVDQSSSSSFWRYFPKLHSKISNFVYKRAHSIVVFNANEYEIACQKSKRVLLGKTWYDEKIFHRNSEVSRSGSIKLVWIGRFEQEKNPIFALHVLGSLVSKGFKVHLSLIGYGSLEQKITECIQELKLEDNITVHGYLPHSSVADILRQSDVLIQSSKYEGSPTVVIESLACGVPVVSADSGDPDRLVVNFVNGFRTEELVVSEFVDYIPMCMNLEATDIVKSVDNRSKSKSLPQLIAFSTHIT